MTAGRTITGLVIPYLAASAMISCANARFSSAELCVVFAMFLIFRRLTINNKIDKNAEDSSSKELVKI